MPEFEEPSTKPDPSHNYTPSNAASNKTGGRRRSGGFKSDATTKTAKIGEVDPAEALKTETLKSASQSKESPENDKKGVFEPTGAACNSDAPQCTVGKRGKKVSSSKPQPSEGTLSSIKSVEEKIAKRRADIEKTRDARNERNARSPKNRSHKNNTCSRQSGLFAAIKNFFGTILGSNNGNSSDKKRGSSSGKYTSKNSNKNYRGGHNRKGNSKPKQNNRRGGQDRRRSGEKRHTAKSLSNKS